MKKRQLIAILAASALALGLLAGCGSATTTTTETTTTENSDGTTETVTTETTETTDLSTGETETTTTETTEDTVTEDVSAEDTDTEQQFRAFLMDDSEDYDEYVVIGYTADDTLLTIVDECHFYKSAGYSAENIKAAFDPDSTYSGFTSALCTRSEIEDCTDYVALMLWWEDLDNMFYIDEAIDMGVIVTSDDSTYTSVSASSYCDSLIANGCTELAATDIETLGLHTTHPENPYYDSSTDIVDTSETLTTGDSE